MKLYWFILCIFYSTVANFNNDKVEYYLNLIGNGTNLAYNSTPRTNAYEYAPNTNKWEEYGVFDHVVVGAGSAGSVIANRLSEDCFRNVLLLEAGGEPSDLINIPSMMAIAMGLEYNWNYTSVPQTTSCLGMNNRQCGYPRGKGLGGSSLINGLVYTRGNREDYDGWCKQGNRGWCYKDVLPLFKKSETFLQGNPRYRGKNGYLNIESVDLNNPITKAFFKANKEFGKKVIDYNSKNQIGVGAAQLNTLNGKRHSTYKAFLQPIIHRSNLRVLTKTYVIKIFINKQKKAVGLLFSKDKKLYLVRSRYDIVLSAGGIGSAQLLMLSGIGPKLHLSQMGIPVIEDLPVGTDIEDHPYLTYLNFVTNFSQPILTTEQNVRNFLNGVGLFTNPFNAKGIAFYNTKHSNATYPDIEIAQTIPPSIDSYLNKLLNFDVETDKLTLTKNVQNIFSLYIALLHPKSKGHLRLRSSNPFDYPLIDLQLLSDPDNVDIETLYEGVKIVLELIKSSGFKKLDTRLRYIPHPNCTQHKYLSRQFWYCQIRHFSTAMYHTAGSCRMGPSPSVGAVVNPELRVFGIDNLRVADASIMPSITSGHTNAPSIMIGEKAAELIRNS